MVLAGEALAVLDLHHLPGPRMERIEDQNLERRTPGIVTLSRRASARRICPSRSAEKRSWPVTRCSSARQRRLVAGLAKAYGERRLDEKLLALAKPKLLIVDELGYLPLEPDAAHLFFQLVSRRYETDAMLITSNRSVAEWGTVFAEPMTS